MKTCDMCRFYENNKCMKFNVTVNEKYTQCNDFCEKTVLNENLTKIKLYD